MEENEDKSNIKLFSSLFFPIVFVVVIWLVKLTEITFDVSFGQYGIFPRKFEGLIGVLFYPLIHNDFNHLISNSTALFLLSVGIFHFYRPVAYKIYFWTYVMSGIWIWLSARESFHIGASGLIYGFATFIFISGIIRQNTRLLALSMLVIFLYGGMVWGIFPIKPGMSFEGHLWGSVAGIILAFYYRKIGPQKRKYSWDLEEELEASMEIEEADIISKQVEIEQGPAEPLQNQPSIKYVYKEKEDD